MREEMFELNDDGEYIVLPEAALDYLPEEWRKHLQTRMEDGRAVLKSVDKELSGLSRLSSSLVSLVALKHVQKRLSEYRFAPTMDALLELEMLTTAFVVTYARLQQSGGGSGFSRDALPAHLRQIHDQIIELRNKRFAHNAGHQSVSDAMEIEFEDDRFEIKLGLQVGYHIGGQVEWPELVACIDQMMFERLEKLQTRLGERTGRAWIIPKGSPPDSAVG